MICVSEKSRTSTKCTTRTYLIRLSGSNKGHPETQALCGIYVLQGKSDEEKKKEEEDHEFNLEVVFINIISLLAQTGFRNSIGDLKEEV